MWPFNMTVREPVKKGVDLKPCPFCTSKNVTFYSQSSDYFRYVFRIKCQSCAFEQEYYGKTETEHNPENFKKDWDKFISTWNNRGN